MKIDESSVFFKKLQNHEGLLLNTITGEYYTLNEQGTLIWTYLARGKSEDFIVKELCGKYEVARQRAAHDITAFLKMLFREKLVQK